MLEKYFFGSRTFVQVSSPVASHTCTSGPEVSKLKSLKAFKNSFQTFPGFVLFRIFLSFQAKFVDCGLYNRETYSLTIKSTQDGYFKNDQSILFEDKRKKCSYARCRDYQNCQRRLYGN